MKECRYCHKSYPENYFGVSLTTKNKVYRRLKCRDCYRKTKRILLEKHQRWVEDYKRNGSCSRCGLKDYRVIDFHHCGDKKKEFSISVGLAEKFGFDRMGKEVTKCVLLCSNCHRILHHEESLKRKNNRGVVQR